MIEITDEHREFLLATARKAARSTSGSVVDMARRPKSVAWLLGKFRERFGLEIDESKRIVKSVTLSWRGDDDLAVFDDSKARRPSIKGREASDSPKWDERVGQLALALRGSYWSAGEIYAAARERWKWSPNFTMGVLASADLKGILSWFSTSKVGPAGLWAPSEVARRTRDQLHALRDFEVPDRDLKGPITTTVEMRDGRWVPYRVYTEDQMAELRAHRTIEEKVSRGETGQDGDMAKETVITPEERLERLKKANLRNASFEGRLERKRLALETKYKALIDAELAPVQKLVDATRATLRAELDALGGSEEDEEG